MILPPETLVAIADGEKFHLFRSAGTNQHAHLEPLGHPKVEGSNHSGGARHASSASNPDEKQDAEDMHAAATAEWLNRAAVGNKFEHAVVIAPPKMLGELRKHYHKALEAKILKEIPKDMTGQSRDVIASAIEHA